MGRQRKTTKHLEKAQARAAGIKNISPTLDLGGGVSLPALNTAIAEAGAALADYNQALAAADDKSNVFAAKEATAKDLAERLVAGVGARYGRDSSEYEQAGGVRKSERKRPTRKAKPPKPPAGG